MAEANHTSKPLKRATSDEIMTLLAKKKELQNQVEAIKARLEIMMLYFPIPSPHSKQGYQQVPFKPSLPVRTKAYFPFYPSHLNPAGACPPNSPGLQSIPPDIIPSCQKRPIKIPFSPKRQIDQLQTKPLTLPVRTSKVAALPKPPAIKLPARIPKNIKRYTQGKRVYPPIAICQAEVLEILLASRHLTLVPASPPPQNLPSFYWPYAKCSYHSGQTGHDVEYCQALRNKVERLIDAKVIILSNVTSTDRASFPFPSHQ